MPFLEVLGDMLPTSFFDNIANGMTGNAKSFGQNSLVCFALCVATTNFNYLSFRELGMDRLFATGLALLGALVLIVVVLCAKKQMIGVNAGRIVAAMTNKHGIRDRAAMKFVRKSVSAFGYIRDESKYAISSGARRAFPYPTAIGIRSVYLFPESVFYRLRDLVFAAMPMNKARGLPFDMAVCGSCSLGNWGGLTTAALAEFCRGLLRGMIHDVTSSFKLLTMPRDTRNVAVALLLVNLIIPKGAVLCHS